LIVDSFSIFADFYGSAGPLCGTLSREEITLCPAHEKNAEDLEIGHASIRYVM
jgi:hypothetical protein